ncbi:MAG: alpha/beta hydrolase [Chloroflexota bacterium]
MERIKGFLPDKRIKTTTVPGHSGVFMRFTGPQHGELIIFLHGLGCDGSIWKHQLITFGKQGYRAIALDLPGIATESVRQFDSFTTYTEYAVDLIKAVAGDQPVTLVGNSFGGALAISVALQAPTLVRRLILIDTAGVEPPDIPRMHAARASMLDMFGRIHSRPVWFVLSNLFGLRRMMTQGARGRALVRRMGNPNLWSALPQLHGTNTLVVWGADDQLIPAEIGQAIAAVLSAEFVSMVSSGHMPQVEKPAELSQVLLEWIDATQNKLT